jgi:hypothetical protein
MASMAMMMAMADAVLQRDPRGEAVAGLGRVLEIDRNNKNEEDQINHRDIRILTWKILQYERKNYGHQSVTTFTIFVKCLQERRDMLRPKPLDDGPPLRSPTWPPSKNLDHNSTISILRQIPSCGM